MLPGIDQTEPASSSSPVPIDEDTPPTESITPSQAPTDGTLLFYYYFFVLLLLLLILVMRERCMFPVIAAIPCMLGVATKYCQSEKTIVVAFFYDEGSWYRNPQE